MVAQQDWNRTREVGSRRGLPPVGLEDYGRLAQACNALSRRDILRPRGVFRFHSFEEAQDWWETTWTVGANPRGPQPPTTSRDSVQP